MEKLEEATNGGANKDGVPGALWGDRSWSSQCMLGWMTQGSSCLMSFVLGLE